MTSGPPRWLIWQNHSLERGGIGAARLRDDWVSPIPAQPAIRVVEISVVQVDVADSVAFTSGGYTDVLEAFRAGELNQGRSKRYRN
jgi:hypothetical protein